MCEGQRPASTQDPNSHLGSQPAASQPAKLTSSQTFPQVDFQTADVSRASARKSEQDPP